MATQRDDRQKVRSTEFGSESDWLIARRAMLAAGLIGASNVPAILAANPFETSADLRGYYRSGRWPDLTGNLNVELGRYLEPFIASKVSHLGTITGGEKPTIWTNDDYPHLFATPDRILNGDTVLELKFSTWAKSWLSSPPEMHVWQVRAQMMVCGMQHGVIAGLVYDRPQWRMFTYEITLIPSERELIEYHTKAFHRWSIQEEKEQ